MKTTKLNFAKNFNAKVEIEDLEKLGWEFNHDETARAMGVSVEEAEKYNKENYSIEITVNPEGATLWRFSSVPNAPNGLREGSDNEHTGDDEQTIKDLQRLYNERKLFDIKTDYYDA